MPMLLRLQMINQDRIFLHFYRLFPDTLTALYGHGLDYLIILLRMADTSSGANLHPTPFRDSRSTFLKYIQARHDITLGFTLGLPSLAGALLPHRFCMRSSAYSKHISVLGR